LKSVLDELAAGGSEGVRGFIRCEQLDNGIRHRGWIVIDVRVGTVDDTQSLEADGCTDDWPARSHCLESLQARSRPDEQGDNDDAGSLEPRSNLRYVTEYVHTSPVREGTHLGCWLPPDEVEIHVRHT
jgi:hypothetical protein